MQQPDMLARRQSCRRASSPPAIALVSVFLAGGSPQPAGSDELEPSPRYETVTFYQKDTAESAPIVIAPSSARELVIPTQVGRVLRLAALERFGVRLIELAPHTSPDAIVPVLKSYNEQSAGFPRVIAVAGSDRRGNPIYSGGSADLVVVNEVLIRLERGTAETRIAELSSTFRATVIKKPGVVELDVYLLHFPGKSGHDARALAKRLEELPGVEHAQPNFYVIDPQRLPDAGVSGGPQTCFMQCPEASPPVGSGDRFLAKQWHLNSTSTVHFPTGWEEYPDINAKKAWNITLGNRSVVVAVLDDLIETTHEDLAANICSSGEACAPYDAWPAPQAGEDDVSRVLTDNDFHGTAAAGLAAGVSGNLKGIAGVAGNVKIMPVRMLVEGVPNVFAAIDAITHAANHARVLSMSWQLGDEASVRPLIGQFVEPAIEYAVETKKRVLVFAAHQLYGSPGQTARYPASLADEFDIIAVSATDDGIQLKVKQDLEDPCDWSTNFSEDAVSAPGVNLYTTDRTGGAGYCAEGDFDNYALFGGTSGATPLVAGVAALMLSLDSSLSPIAVRNRLQKSAWHPNSSARPTDSIGWGIGWGRIDACLAVQDSEMCVRPMEIRR